jgi:hypothetical protein
MMVDSRGVRDAYDGRHTCKGFIGNPREGTTFESKAQIRTESSLK